MIKRIREILNLLSWGVLKRIGLTPKLISTITRTSKLSEADIQLLESMKSDSKKSQPPFKSTEIWTGIGGMFEDWFYWEGIGNVEQQKMNGWFSSPAPKDPKLLRYACWLLYQNVKSRDELGLLDKIEAGSSAESGLCFDFEGRKVSWDNLISLDSLYSIYEVDEAILRDPVVVVDIGAGWGRIGYALLKANPKAKYVILDLPQVLMVSSTYLPTKLPGSHFLSYESSRGTRRFDHNTLDGYSGAFLGTFDLDKFCDKSIDFVINVASFQEMTREQVGLYFEKIDKKLNGIFYTQQLWTASTHTFNLGEIAGYKDFPFMQHWKSRSLKSATWSDLYFETILEVK